MSAMLHKAAHITKILALFPVLYCAYVVWVFIHPQQYPAGPPKFVSLNATLKCFVAFLGLFLLSTILGTIALVRGTPKAAPPPA